MRSVTAMARARLDLRFVEVDGTWQEAGPLRFRAVEVVHVPYLRCFGYLFDRGDRTVAYSGDTTLCDGLSELARESDVLVVECNGHHGVPGEPVSHMAETSIRELQAAHPGVAPRPHASRGAGRRLVDARRHRSRRLRAADGVTPGRRITARSQRRSGSPRRARW